MIEVVRVSKNEDLVFANLQVVALSLKGFNNSKELLIMSLIPSLDEDYLLREKDYKVLLVNFGLRRKGPVIGYVIGRMIF